MIMKILLLDNSGINYENGEYFIDKRTGEFAEDLKNLGHDITFFGQIIYNSNTHTHVYSILKNGMHTCGLRRRNKILTYVLLYLKSIPVILRSDFVYMFYPNAFKYVTFFCKLAGKSYGLYIRGMQGINTKVSHKIYSHAYTIFTVSDYFTGNINKSVGRDVANTIRPMISFTEKDIIKSREYISKERYNLLYLGRTTDDKGIIELLHAVAKLKQQNYNFHLTIVGNVLKILAGNLKINDLVSFEGGIFDQELIKKYYLDADIFILPSYHEGFPRTLYESMIFGTPIVTTFVGGISLLMKDNFKEIKPKSIDSIINVLDYAMNNYQIMGEMAKNGTKTVQYILKSRKMPHAEHLHNILINEKNTQ